MIHIDGSKGEGGGQMLRTALALSIITGKPFEMRDIRKNRPEPGLKNQHLHTINAYRQIYDLKVEDAYIGSERIMFVPGKLKRRKIDIHMGTAGSITLMLQSLLLPCLLEKKPITIKITGGTDVRWSMSYDYLCNVVVPQLNRFGEISCSLLRRGYYPEGNGSVEVKLKPIEKTPGKIDLTERGKLMHIRGISHASKDLSEKEVAERQMHHAKQVLSGAGCDTRIESRYSESSSTGSGIALWAIFSLNELDIDSMNPIRIGADALGEIAKRAEDVGEEAAKDLLEEIGKAAPVDRHLADNMIPLLGVLKGKIKVSDITDHVRSNIYVCESFLDVKYHIDDKDNIISAD